MVAVIYINVVTCPLCEL